MKASRIAYMLTGNLLEADEQMPMEEAAYPAASESLEGRLGVLETQAGSDRCRCRGWDVAEKHHEGSGRSHQYPEFRQSI